ncbi:MAG: dockerin type I repeat-containing protein [Bacteroidaceae bacterium]|nr:dockerin type I repeat-containing protein [Bacteroidaceae bacterium]
MRKKLLNLWMTALLCAVSTAAWALSEADGFYQIGTPEDYAEFAALVNGGELKANAILTADIDLGTDIDSYKIYNGEYQGVFDGAGHTVTINFSDGTKDNQGPALFRSLNRLAVVKRLKVQGTLTTERQHSAAIANYSSGTIRDCWVEVHVVCTKELSDASAAALVGQCNFVSVTENNLAIISVDAPGSHKFGGVAAWADESRLHFANNLCLNDDYNFDISDGKSAGIVRNDNMLAIVDLETYNADSYHNWPQSAAANNYVLDDWGCLNKGTVVVTTEDVASGKVCFMLNSDQSDIRWTQVIGTDPYPVPAVFRPAGQVYASVATACDGTTPDNATYSNEGSVLATAHTYDQYGVCTTCGEFNWNYFDLNDPNKYDPVKKAFVINEGKDFFVIETWNRFHNGLKYSMELGADVTCTPPAGQVIFNTNGWIEGSFYGQNHTLTIEMVDITEDYAALFPKWYSSGQVIENLILHGTINTDARNAGSLVGRDYGNNNKVRNVFSDVTINATHIGDCSHGGFIYCGGNNTTFDNCIYAGDINGVEGSEAVAGFCGWGNGNNYYNNCAFIGTINNFTGDTQTISRNAGVAHSNNIYSLNTYGSDVQLYTKFDNQEGIASGELAFLLNEKQQGFDRFYQVIGTDKEPMPIAKDGALVYAAGTLRCDGNPVPGETIYANEPSEVGVPSHQFEDGFCSICGVMQEDYMTPVDGWFEISTPGQLLWWNNFASQTDLSASARLTADIDMTPFNESFQMTDGTERVRTKHFMQLGTESAPFYGNFDGQFHTIRNLHMYLPGCRGAGFIGVMNSLPTSDLGGLSADEARAAEGVFVKDVVFENSSIYGKGYVGIVGMAANWAGHITMSGVLNLGEATVDGGCNVSGMFGCAMGSNCHMTITGCGFIGNTHVKNDTHTENGLFSGWLGSYAEVTNCFAFGTVDSYPDPARSWARHPNNSTVVITNCYAQEGSGVIENGYNGNEEVIFVPAEELASGVLTWKVNGEQFRNPLWFQTIGDDDNPTPLPNHGVVIYAAEQYFCAVTDEDVLNIATTILPYEDAAYDEAVETTVATQSLIDAWKEAVEALTDSTTIASFTLAYYNIVDTKAAVYESAAVYQAYIDKCAEISANLENDKTFEGSLRDALEYYLSGESAEPDETNPLGTYAYIIANHTATNEEILSEIARLDQWLLDAISSDYSPGTDVSKLLKNGDFAQKNAEGWTGAWCNAFGEVANSQLQGGNIVGVEAWNRTGDMFQTVEDMKPGYYLVGVSGAFRPSNNRYSTNYAAGIYANGIFNYFPTVIEDYVAAADTVDQVNCNLHGQGALDLPVYDDNFSLDDAQADDNGANLLGFVVHGPYGMAAAANAGRYQVYTIAKVGEDGKLTIGIKSDGTKYSNDWVGWGPISILYTGTDEAKSDEALDKVLQNMTARAKNLIDYSIGDDFEDPNATPNFSLALRDSLQQVVGAIEGAATVEAKAELAETFSRLFQKVYECKRAYADLYNYASILEWLESGNLPLIEKDEAGDWYETDDMVFSDADLDAIYGAFEDMYDAFNDGTYTTEQALNPTSAMSPETAELLATIVPEKDDDGYYLIANAKQFVAYRALVNSLDNTLKAKLDGDVDMSGIGMEPIRFNDVFSGTFDGQGHALENVCISHYGDMHTALFFELKNATVKNLKLTGEYHSDQQRMAGLAAWTSGTTNIDNCEIAVALYSDKEGDGTHGGVMAVHGRGGICNVSNCIVACQFIGPNTFSVGGVCGWRDATLNVRNTLVLSEYDLAAEPASYQTATISRNGYTDQGNVFYGPSARREDGINQATGVSDQQLASGEITWKLNGSQSETPVWFQTIGTDATPRLFGGLVVYEREGTYFNMLAGDANADGSVDVADYTYILNLMADEAYDPMGDVNGDGFVDVADATYVLNIMADQQ